MSVIAGKRENEEAKDENDNYAKEEESLIVSHEKKRETERKKDISSDVFYRIF
jgi:hypothetical protein